MICPLILKQTKKTENGLEEWEHQPCLEEACSLFFAKKKKCSLSHNSETSQEMRNILERADFLSWFQVLKAGTDRLSEGLQEEAATWVRELRAGQEAFRQEVGSRLAELSETLREGLSQEVRALQQAVDSLPERFGAAVQEVQDRLSRMEEETATRIEEARREARELGAGLGEKTARMEGILGDLVARQDSLGEKMEVGHRAAEEKMETLLGEIRHLLEDLQAGNQEIRDYYAERREAAETETLARHRAQAREENNRGVVYFHRGAREAAALAFEKAVDLDPEYAEAYNNLGLTYTELERSDHAVQAFEKALTLRPDLAETYNNLGLLYYDALEYEKATEMFTRALEQGCRDRSMAYTNFGNSLYQLQRYEEAAGAWSRALEMNPLNQNARKGLALLKEQEQEVP